GVAPAQSSGKLGQQSSEKQVEWGTNRGVPPLITTRKMGTLENRAGSIADGGEVLRAALARALESAEFHQSPRMSQLLRYLVETTLADRAGELKETVIGVEVFGRPVDYDPKVDPVVRKEVRRLRLKLQEYYQGSGSGDSTRIEIAKGAYVP